MPAKSSSRGSYRHKSTRDSGVLLLHYQPYPCEHLYKQTFQQQGFSWLAAAPQTGFSVHRARWGFLVCSSTKTLPTSGLAGAQKAADTARAIGDNTAALQETCHFQKHFPPSEGSELPVRFLPLSEQRENNQQQFSSPP